MVWDNFVSLHLEKNADMKKILLLIALNSMLLVAYAQEAGATMKPNYRKIARVVADPSGPYFMDSLESRFARQDTSLTVDDLRCLYYGGEGGMLSGAHTRLMAVGSRFGMASRQAGVAWWHYQMLTTAVWSSGNGSRRRPLHVTSRDDAQQVATDFGAPLWFKIKGRRRFSVAPLR